MYRTALVVSALWMAAAFTNGADAQEENLEERVAKLESKLLDQPDEDDANTFRVFWNNGLRMETPDKNFEIKIGGRIHNDYLFVLDENDNRNPSLDLDEENRVFFRRARLYIGGTIYKIIGFKVQYDFAGGDADFKDVYIEVKKIPWLGTVQVGQFKEPLSLEELTSSNYITFIERSVMNAFTPSRSTGFMLHNDAADKLITWAMGAFFDSDDYGDHTNGGKGAEINFTGRITASPLYADKGRQVVHIGAGASHRNPNGDMFRIRSRPEVRTQDRFVDTGSMTSENASLYNFETAVVFGPFSAQAEYARANVDVRNGSQSDPEFSAWYAQASFFLTGESMKYERKKGAFGRVSPNKNFGEDCGFGAVQLAVRYSRIDLNETFVQGGKMSNITVGVNWFLNPNTRFMVNYVIADRDTIDPYQFLAARFQIDF